MEEKKERYLVFVRIFQRDSDHSVLKSRMFCSNETDILFLRAYLSGLVLTLAID